MGEKEKNEQEEEGGKEKKKEKTSVVKILGAKTIFKMPKFI